MTGRDEFTGSRTDRAGRRPTAAVGGGRLPALEAALAEARDLPDGPARQVTLERLAERADAAGDVRSGVDARFALIEAYLLHGERWRLVEPVRRCRAAADHRPELLTDNETGLLLRYQRYAVEALLGTPRVGLDQTRSLLHDLAHRVGADGPDAPTVAELHCRIADHLGDEPTARHWYERWSGNGPAPPVVARAAPPARRAELLAGWGEWRAALGELEKRDGEPEPCTDQPERDLVAGLLPALRAGEPERAAAAHVRAYRRHRREPRRVPVPRRAPAVLRAGRAPGTRADHPGRAAAPTGPSQRRPRRDGVRRRRGAGLRAGRGGRAGRATAAPTGVRRSDPPPSWTWPHSAPCCSGWPTNWPAASTPATAPATTPAGWPPGSRSARSRHRLPLPADDEPDAGPDADGPDRRRAGSGERELTALTVDMITAVLDGRGDQYLVEEGDTVVGRWGGAVIQFRRAGERGEVLHARAMAARRLPATRRSEAYAFCNAWNHDRLLPKAYAHDIGEELVLAGDVATDLAHGVAPAQLRSWSTRPSPPASRTPRRSPRCPSRERAQRLHVGARLCDIRQDATGRAASV